MKARLTHRGGRKMFKTQNMYQNDEKWKNTRLGNSNETIGGWGCLLTSATMMLNGIGYNENSGECQREDEEGGRFSGRAVHPECHAADLAQLRLPDDAAMRELPGAHCPDRRRAGSREAGHFTGGLEQAGRHPELTSSWSRTRKGRITSCTTLISTQATGPTRMSC